MNNNLYTNINGRLIQSNKIGIYRLLDCNDDSTIFTNNNYNHQIGQNKIFIIVNFYIMQNNVIN